MFLTYPSVPDITKVLQEKGETGQGLEWLLVNSTVKVVAE